MGLQAEPLVQRLAEQREFLHRQAIPALEHLGFQDPAAAQVYPVGSGPGSTVVEPNQPFPLTAGPTIGRASGSNIGPPVGTTNTGGPRQSASDGRSRARAPDNDNFHPEAVIDGALDAAASDIAAVTSSELRSLIHVFKTCTANEHSLERVGKCGAVNRVHRSKFVKGRQIDRSMTELERVVRFQNMFRRVSDTEYEDHINNRLRS